jgi:uncharacterized membrane protein YhaH (DUF805 family)
MNQDVQDNIKKAREAGMSDEQIKQELIKAGWQQNEINQEFNDATPFVVPTLSSAPVSVQNIAKKDKSIFYYYLLAFKRYFIFKGRSRRKEYWSFVLINSIVSILLGIFGFLVIKDRGIWGSVFALIIMIPSIAVFVRRLHDINKSGWWWFFNFVPVIGTIVLLVFMFKEGQMDTNKYGPNPKTSEENT